MDDKYIIETKEIHHDSLRKYVNIAECKLKEHGKVEKDFGRVRAFLETKSVVLSREECRPQACMQTCENGAWFHYGEVEDLIAEKDKEIEELKKKVEINKKLVGASTDIVK